MPVGSLIITTERLAEVSKKADDDEADLQILLRIEYSDYQIVHVEEVSDRPVSFFDQEILRRTSKATSRTTSGPVGRLNSRYRGIDRRCEKLCH